MNDVFYRLKNKNVRAIKGIFRWADRVGFDTKVTMLGIDKSSARIKSDKNFERVLNAIDENAVDYFRVILRKQMNLFGILYGDKVVKDMLEIAVRGIDMGNKEYFIVIYLDKMYLAKLKQKGLLKRIGPAKGGYWEIIKFDKR